MMAVNATASEIDHMLEELDSNIRALHALSGLLNGCSNADSVEPSELTYLLDPIINSEKSLLDQMRGLLTDSSKAKANIALVKDR
ncbi:MAG: hypothetical protein Q8Q50_04770 [Methylobacter sp.]|nr:hypothetical protein [Methylobacter sp.]